MSVGTILTLTADNRVVRREPTWPWPPKGAYPRNLEGGGRQVFVRNEYFHYSLNEQFKGEHPHGRR